MEKLLLTIDEVVAATGIGRTKVFELIKKGELPKVKIGSRTGVEPDAVRALVRTAAERSAKTEAKKPAA